MTIYSARWYVTKAAANNEKRDARLLYIMVLASSRFANLIELRTFMLSKRDGLFCGSRYLPCAASGQSKLK